MSAEHCSIEHVFDTSWIAGLDADGACGAVVGTQVDLREAEWRELLESAGAPA